MARIGNREATFLRDFCAKACSKPGETHVSKDLIEMIEQLGRMIALSPLRCAEKDRCGHRCGRSFSAYITEQNALAVSRKNATAIKVSSNLTDGKKCDFETEAVQST